MDSPGIALIKASEGCRYMAYDDQQPGVIITSRSQVRGKLTIGYGATGPAVTVGLVWTQAQCDADLLARTAPILDMLEDPNVIVVDLNDNQKGALLSFIYNVGAEAFRRSSMIRHVNSGAYSEVTQDFYLWVFSNGIRMPGLMRRRIKEATLWNFPVEDSDAVLNA